MKKIDLDSWNRKEHFRFFNSFDEPYFSFVALVDCAAIHAFAKANQLSFFSLYLHRSLLAANGTEAFRLRIQGQDVVLFDQVHASSTIGRPDNTFGFSFIPFYPDFSRFSEALQAETAAVKESAGLRFREEMMRADVIHYSSIPWIHFTSLSHPRRWDGRDSVPKITFGQTRKEGNRLLMPVGVHAHHALMDGYHVGLFFNFFEELLQSI